MAASSSLPLEVTADSLVNVQHSLHGSTKEAHMNINMIPNVSAVNIKMVDNIIDEMKVS